MARKARGVKHLTGDTFLIDYQVRLERRQERIHAASIAEARVIREERKMELRKQASLPKNGQERLNATFDEAWQKLEADLKADNVCLKNVQRYTRIFQGLFYEFLPLKFPEIKSPSELRLPFFLEYKNYFVNELKRNPNGGLRAELICIKSMMRRFKKLGFCEKDVVEGLTEIKRPNSIKKRYPDVPNDKLKELLGFIKQDSPYFYSPIYFACRTGRRINEILSIEKRDLEWNGLNPTRINIRSETTKTKNDAPHYEAR